MNPSRVAFLGLGNMGAAMARNLQKAGFALSVYNRTASKADPFRALGATVGATPKTAARDAEVVIAMLSDAHAVEEVLFGTEGVAQARQRDLIVADMSTLAPTQSRAIAERATALGWRMLDAPVAGGVKAAQEAKLVVLAGGEREVFDACLPVFQAMSQRAFYLGSHGMGAAMKLALQINLTLLLEGLCEFLTFARRAGLDPQQAVEILNTTTSNRSGVSENRGPLIAAGVFPPSFALRLMVKDLTLITDTASAMRVPLPGLSTVRELYLAALAMGYAEQDYTTIVKVLEHLAGLDVPPTPSQH